MNIPIFCINLERATERRQKIEKLWIKQLKFDITFWKAWDRRDIDNGKFYFTYDKDLAHKIMKRQLSSGEIACATSHCMILEYAIKNNIDECIIMEDDILPTTMTHKIGKDKFFKTILSIKEELPDCNIALLHEIYHHLDGSVPIKETENFKMYEKLPFGNQMTYYNKLGLISMFNNLHKINYCADHWNIFPFSSPIKDICLIKKALGRHEYGSSPDACSFIGPNLRKSNYYSKYKE